MIDSKILIPIDFTPAADTAIEFGKLLATKSQSGITLLHIYEDEDLTCEECQHKLNVIVNKLIAEGVNCHSLMVNGSIFTEIPDIASSSEYSLMVIAAHGRVGIRQKMFGPYILKLLKKIPVPALVVQEESKLPEGGFKKAVFPVGAHDDFVKKINAMILFAGIFDTEIDIYSIDKPGFDQTNKLRENILMAEERFTQKGVRFKRTAEDQKIFSIGYASQTMKYAEQQGVDMLAIMSVPTQENAYFADSDKEIIIMNDLKIPVLCTSDVEQDL